MQLEPELLEPHAHRIPEAPRVGFVLEASNDVIGQNCWLQKGLGAHTLTGLSGIPVLIATGEASYHAQYDHCNSAFLAQAGVPNTWLNLATVGIRGNGHMQMIESNNLEIARYYERWLLSKLQ